MEPVADGGGGRVPLGRRELCAAVALLALAVAMRGVILFAGQRHLRSDEAAVGLMAKHIVTRGERPVFLYGQPYGGGHAMVAYVAAPLFAMFGRSAVLLTGISALISTGSIVLVWLILRRCFGPGVALAGGALYAFSPPVVYQAFLVNGGTETFFLALVSLVFFLRGYLDGRATWANGVFTGLFSGLAYYGMDYALLYPVVFVLLWVASRRAREWRWLGAFAIGFVIGCLPLVLYNLTHDFVHLRYMFAAAPGARVGLLAHFAKAIWGVLGGNLAAFFGGDIDDYKPAALDAWIHAVAAILAVIVLAWRHGRDVLLNIRTRLTAGVVPKPLPAAAMPVVFILIYLCMYGVARFSLPGLAAPPRYLLPLCPFVSMAIALAMLGVGEPSAAPGQRNIRPRLGTWQGFGLALVTFLVLRGAAASVSIGTRAWHEEHNVRTSGAEIKELAGFLQSKGVKYAFAPYEIQWRLMFEADESMLVSSDWISPLPRYGWYHDAVADAFEGGATPIAAVFRRDFAFAEWATERRMGLVTREGWRAALRRFGHSPDGTRVGNEFEVFYPVPRRMLAPLARVRPQPGEASGAE